MSEVGRNSLILTFLRAKRIVRNRLLLSPWYVNTEFKTWASAEDNQISHREYFPIVMVNVSQCLPINNRLTAAHVQLDKEMDISNTNI